MSANTAATMNNTHTPFYNFLIRSEYRIWRHVCLILVGALVTVNYVMPREGYEVVNTTAIALYFLSILVSYMIVIYFNIYILMPVYLIRKRYLHYLLAAFLSVCLLLAGQYGLERLFSRIIDPIFFTLYNFDNCFILFLDIFSNIFLNLTAFIGCSVTVLLRHWIIDTERAGKLERQHMQAELDRLKEQVNPDFLFSTLRSIGSLESSEPEKASAMLMRFSHLLRYQLYDCSRENVFLSSEIQFLSNYLSLRKLSCDGVQFDISSTGETLRALVPPLLFIPFVQDVVNKVAGANGETHIALNFHADDECVRFECTSNNYGGEPAADFSRIKQRLNLLFGDGYRLEITPRPALMKYAVNLQIMY